MTYQYLNHIELTISAGQSVSNAVQLAERLLVGIVMPSGWAAADLTFQASRDNVTYRNVYDDSGNEKAVVAAASRHIVITPSDFAGIEWLKIRSGTSGVPVAQTADQTITLVVRPV